jgi:molybdopterin converting factor small subunit
MLIRVKLFPALTQLFGGYVTGIMVQMPPSSTIADLRASIAEGTNDEEAVLAMLAGCTFAVNREVASDDWHLREPDEVEVIPPACSD